MVPDALSRSRNIPRVPRRLLLGVFAAALIGCVLPAPALAVARWNHYYVTYRSYVGPPYRAAFADAIRRINAIPVRFRLVAARRGRVADIVLFSADRGPTAATGMTRQTCRGRPCSIGTPRRPSMLVAARVTLNTHFGARRSWAQRVTIVTHELLHGMGLGHSADPCSLMYPGGVQVDQCRGSLSPGRVPCGPQPPEFDLLSEVYGQRDGQFFPGVCSG